MKPTIPPASNSRSESKLPRRASLVVGLVLLGPTVMLSGCGSSSDDDENEASSGSSGGRGGTHVSPGSSIWRRGFGGVGRGFTGS